MDSANAEPMKPPAPVSNIVLPAITLSVWFSSANRSLHVTTLRTSYAHAIVSIHRRTKGSSGARPEVGFLREVREKSCGGDATSRRRVAVERGPVARGGMRYVLLPA